MKKLRILPYLIIFSLNLLVGFLGGSKVLPEKAGKAYPVIEQTAAMSDSIPAMANGQRSILLVTVDKLDALHPRLTGVWAVLYVPANPRLTLLPIFPAFSAGSGEQLVNSFGIQQEAGSRKLDPAFLSLVEEQIPWWSGYILLDQAALAEVVDLWVYSPANPSDSSPLGSSAPLEKYGSRVVSGLPNAQDDPYSALFSQASLYQELCWGLAWSETGSEGSQARERITRIKNHFSTDLDLETILTEIQDLRGLGGSLVCEFPTLSVQARIVQ